jgi:hypothetical protein
VRVEIMGPAKYEKVVGKSQSVLMMINPMIFTRARMRRGGVSQARCGWATSGWRSSFRPSRATGRRWARPTGWRRRWCCAKAPVRDRTAGISPTISLCNMLASARLRFCVGSPTIFPMQRACVGAGHDTERDGPPGQTARPRRRPSTTRSPTSGRWESQSSRWP